MRGFEQIPLLIKELRESAGDGSDWTEDLFNRAADGLEVCLDELEGVMREWGETLDMLKDVVKDK